MKIQPRQAPILTLSALPECAPRSSQRVGLEFNQPEKETGPKKKRYTKEQIIGFLRSVDRAGGLT